METTIDSPAYQVLARKYRPGHFRDLIGQGAMVRTLTNAFEHDRIAHAFILTGVRGVGKTTTARIIAKGLNCQRGERPTVDPCGECKACVAIAQGRHVDVLEMDAASNTKVDQMRELLAAVPYRPADVRYKVYIIDEVHMLSDSSFNALLKTLEEPPPHVVFILATTEIRKVPVTVLSRCQRFDLRRIEPEAMMAHLRGIAAEEGARLTDEALALITRAAEGSVRDALSLLDQAVAHGRETEIDAAAVRGMLGLADRGRVFDLFEAIMAGDARGALAELGRQYADGADPGVVLRDLAELTHWISVLRIAADTADDPTVSIAERDRGRDLAGRLSMRVLSRSWQMLLKALDELALAPNAMMAAEMAVIRLTHVADLPPPEELVRRLTDEGAAAARPRPPAPTAGGPGGGTASAARGTGGGQAAALSLVQGAAPAPRPHVEPAPAEAPPEALARFATFADVLALIGEARDLILLTEVEAHVRVVRYRPGLIEFNPAPGAPADLAGRLGQRLRGLTGARWSVLISDEPGAPSVAEERRRAEADARAEAENHPLIAAALATFPGARIGAVRPLGPAQPADEERVAGVLAPAAEPDDMDADLADIDGDSYVDGDDPFEEDY
jgi:DNA polymerase III subunit gamma/tau